MLARLLRAWHVWFGNGHLYLWSPLDWTRLLSRYIHFSLFSARICPISIQFCEAFCAKQDESLLWSKQIGFEHFPKTELKDLRHKYSIFISFIHLSKSKVFFFIRCAVLLRSTIISSSRIFCGSTFYSSVEFLGRNLNEFFASSHNGFPF